MNKRTVKQCSPEHECSPEEIQALLDEHRAVEADSSITVYVHPTVEEMQHVIKTAESYTGEWYHSKVILTPDVYTGQQKELSERIKAFDEEKGIYLLFEYEIDPETSAKLANMFAEAKTTAQKRNADNDENHPHSQ